MPSGHEVDSAGVGHNACVPRNHSTVARQILGLQVLVVLIVVVRAVVLACVDARRG